MQNNPIPQEVRSDAEAIIQAALAGTTVDPEIAKRIHERAKKITQEVFNTHGVVDIGVPAIRELRGELLE